MLCRRGEFARDSDLWQYRNSKLYTVMAAREMAKRLKVGGWVGPVAVQCQPRGSTAGQHHGCQGNGHRLELFALKWSWQGALAALPSYAADTSAPASGNFTEPSH